MPLLSVLANIEAGLGACVGVLPSFSPDGHLPAGDFPLTLDELRASYLVTGEGLQSPSWDRAWRGGLVDGLEVLVRQLWQVGIDQIFVDGSFVEDKDHPNDIDGYFECDRQYLASRQLHRDLNALDPHKVWTWDWAQRVPDPSSPKDQLPMRRQYRVELYPHARGIFSGIRDRFGNNLQFPSAFRLTRHTYMLKGIVQIIT